MKKYFIVIAAFIIAIVFFNCSGSKKAVASNPVPKSTYESNLATVVMANCSPCHIAGKGNKKPYDNYVNVKSDIDEIIRRIELNPTDKGFMPFKHGKLSDSTITVFKQWRTDGLLEK